MTMTMADVLRNQATPPAAAKHAQPIPAGSAPTNGNGQAAPKASAKLAPSANELNELYETEGREWVDGIDDKAALARLAAMPMLDYDRVRKVEADRLGVRADTLDREVTRLRSSGDTTNGGGSAVSLAEPEPWPTAVAGALMLAGIADVLRRHVVMSKAAADATALWIIHAHAHAAAVVSPILAITSPTPECGKTTTLSALAAMVPRALPASNVTSAAVFRAVEKWCPVLLVDEADTFVGSNDELRGVLNSGHNRATAWVVRTTGDDHEPRRFATWCPKAIGLIGELPATLASRSIVVELRRIGDGETVDPLRGETAMARLAVFGRLAARWATDHLGDLTSAEPDMPDTLRGRVADNWRAMLAIADAAGDDWPARARKAAEALSGGRSEQTASVMLLDDLRALFSDRAVTRLTSAEIVEALGRREDRPWPEWGRDNKPITARQLARLLEPFGIGPKTLRTATDRAKGYDIEAFADAFGRYLPKMRDAVTTAEDSHSGAKRSVTPESAVTDGIAPQMAGNGHCHGVTPGEPESELAGGAALSEDDRAYIEEFAR